MGLTHIGGSAGAVFDSRFGQLTHYRSVGPESSAPVFIRSYHQPAVFIVGTEVFVIDAPQFDPSSTPRFTKLLICKRVRAASAAWHYILGSVGSIGDLADGWRQCDADPANSETGGGPGRGADHEAHAVVLDLGLGQRVEIGDDVRP